MHALPGGHAQPARRRSDREGRAVIPTRATLFGLLSGQLAWLSQRQSILAQNVAHADTPGYRPRDLDAGSFQALVARRAQGPGPIGLARTDPGHQAGGPAARLSLDGRIERDLQELKPDGNAVVLEEQMARMAETNINYQLSSNIYRKYVQMIRTALGGGGGGG